MRQRIQELGDHYSLHSEVIFSVLDSLEIPKDSRVLDIGTGYGNMAIHLASLGIKVTTGEPEEHKWADWKTPAREIGVLSQIEFVPFRAEKMPFDNGSFNYIFTFGSFHHMEEKKKAMEEIYRVLKFKSYLVIFEMNEAMVERIRKRRGKHPDAVNPLDYVDSKKFKLLKQSSSELLNIYILQKIE